MQKLQIALNQCKIVPVVVVDDVQHAAPLAQALQRGGMTVVEVTLRTAAALDVITAMRAAPLCWRSGCRDYRWGNRCTH